jgi:RHS repeat-associated protein
VAVASGACGSGSYVWCPRNWGSYVWCPRNCAPFGYGDLLSQRRSSATSFYHFDSLGSTRALTESDEDISDTYLYDAWGVPKASTGSTTNPYRYVGKLGYLREAAVEGYLLRRRYYRTGVGRFLSRDPGHEVVPPYGYAHGSPLMLTDPSGEQPQGFLDCNAHCAWAMFVSPVWYGMCMYACMTGVGAFAPIIHACTYVAGGWPVTVADPDATCGGAYKYFEMEWLKLEMKEPDLTPAERAKKEQLEALMQGCKEYERKHMR